MATISKLKLDIKKGSSVSDVMVSYDICFNHCERLAESVFIEKVTLWGEDFGPDDRLITLSHNCVKASKPCVSRKIARKVPNKILDEDDTFFNRKDEVYARVSLTPFTPAGKVADSNIISSRF
ncbi:hypothetical protein POV27_06825 [Aureisphaera galaxeae]|uniref:hypothetical protein n=1 Tax=Aureisphaera galaxeae TaxID=1538023 RepID=UPI002350765D|nr:hypothetical protein [Aureisphaera galaxeae]MDC8003757.1 hypothetical protein [Aureisphaera galaxeae]